MEQGNAIQLSVVLFLSAYNRCSNGCTAANECQSRPQPEVAVIAGLGILGAIAVGEADFFNRVVVVKFSVLVIL